jgi:hypothetical protein
VRAWGLLLALLVPAVSRAQQIMASPKQDAPLDSATQYYRGMLVALRTSVDAVSTSANDLRRDLLTAGDATVLAKAERVSRTCAATRPPLREAIQAVARARRGPRLDPVRDSLRRAIRALDAGLEQHCVRGLAPTGPGVRADTLRAWGRYRTAELQQLIVLYHSAAARFAAALGFKLPPVESP